MPVHSPRRSTELVRPVLTAPGAPALSRVPVAGFRVRRIAARPQSPLSTIIATNDPSWLATHTPPAGMTTSCGTTLNIVISVHSGRNTCSRAARTQPQLGDFKGISDGRLSDVSVDAFHDLNLRHSATLHHCPAHEVLLSAPDTSANAPGFESREARPAGATVSGSH